MGKYFASCRLGHWLKADMGFVHCRCLLLTQCGHTLSSFDTVRYPVEIGLVANPNQPGDNVTGAAIFDTSLSRGASNLFR